MSTRRTLIASAVGVTLLAAGSGFAFAQMKPGSDGDRPAHHRAMDHGRSDRADGPERAAFQPGRHIEGRIAFLKAELKITDAQAPAFDKFAEAVRTTAKEADARMEARRAAAPKPPAPPAAGQAAAPAERPKPPTALEQVERRAEGAKFMAASSQRILDSFKPLYTGLNDEQKKTADELVGRYLGPHGGSGPHMGHRRG